MSELKKLSPQGIERALDKVERYRLLNEPWEAESICLDVLEVDPGNQKALISLLLARADQFRQERSPAVGEVQELLTRLDGAYEQAYYAGIICERKGTSILERAQLGGKTVAHGWLTKAMAHYAEAEALRPPGNDDALLRWNTCARLIDRYDLKAPSPERRVTLLE